MPDLAAEPDGAASAIIEQGHEVGMLARTLFPGGVAVSSEGGLDKVANESPSAGLSTPPVEGNAITTLTYRWFAQSEYR